MFTELAVALEAAGVGLPDPGELNGLETVADVEKLVGAPPGAQARERAAEARPRKLAAARQRDATPASVGDDDIDVPGAAGRRSAGAALRCGQRALYERVLETDVYGRAYVPPFGGYIVAANHASHLDMGLVKHALGEQGDALVALAAKDYFFEDPVRRMYFENFTNLVPMERHGSLRESLRLAGDVIRDGYILLIFPEGTRSETGVMIDFKPSLGYLALTNRCGILPMYLAGHPRRDAQGRVPAQARRAGRGPRRSVPVLRGACARWPRASARGRVVPARSPHHVEGVVRRLAPERATRGRSASAGRDRRAGADVGRRPATDGATGTPRPAERAQP